MTGAADITRFTLGSLTRIGNSAGLILASTNGPLSTANTREFITVKTALTLQAGGIPWFLCLNTEGTFSLVTTANSALVG